MKGLVAIIGRPNVGKSTIFNRLTGSSDALVNDKPGLTRDRIYGVVRSSEDDNDGYMVVDTGGFETKGVYYQPFAKNLVWEQTELAVEDADLVLLVLDGRNGIHPHDYELTRFLKKQNKEIIFVINKVDSNELEQNACEFYQLGIDSYTTVSAAHNRGVGDLSDDVEERLKQNPELIKRKAALDEATAIALIGRPNVGKSSILNRLAGEGRAIVSEIAGTTRDAVDTSINYNQKPYIVIDTAGIRRKARISEKIESLSVMKSLRAVERADVVLLIIDAEQGLAEQDARLASMAVSQYKPMIIVVNKWDLIKNKDSNSTKTYAEDIRYQIKALAYIPILFVSCKTNQRIFNIMSEVEAIGKGYEKRISTADLNKVLAKVVQEHTPALIRNFKKRIKFYYATQVKARPPTIVVMCNLADDIQESYKRYMTHRFRDLLGFGSIPLRIIFRGKMEVSAKKQKVPDFIPVTKRNAKYMPAERR